MAIYYGVVVPSQEFLEAVAIQKTGTKDLKKLYDLILASSPFIYDDLFDREEDYLEYLMLNGQIDIFRIPGISIVKSRSYTFIGHAEVIEYIAHEELNSSIDKIISDNKIKVENAIKKLDLFNYETHAFIGPGCADKLKLPNNYTLRYRKL